MSKSEARDLDGVLEQILEEASGDAIEVRDVMEAFGHRSFAPAMVFSGLVGLTPIGAIPGVPAVCATLVILITGQAFFGKGSPWIPAAILDKEISRDRLERTRKKFGPVIRVIDRVLTPRLPALTEPPANYVLYVIATLYSASYFVLGFIPFGVMVPAFGVFAAGLAVLFRDGVLAIISVVSPLIVGGLIWTTFNGS